MEGSFENDIKDQLKKFDYHKDKKDGYYVNLSSKNIDKYIEIVKKNLKKDYWCEIIGSRYIFIFGDGEVIEVKDIKDEEGALKKCKKFYDGVKDCYNLTRMLWNCGFYHDLVCNTDVKEGVMINSDQFNSMSVKKCITEITKWIEKEGAGKKAVNYKLRDWVFSRQHYWGEPIPIIHCKKCASASSTPNSGEVPVPEKDLPVVLPKVKNYEPTDTGESPLAAMADWVNTKCPKCGGPAKRETDTMPNWAGSSWYFLRYIDPNNSKALADPKKLKHWMPVDLYNGGMEHTTLHLLYSRFWNKFLYDIGVVPTSEPYAARRSHGMVLAEDSQKMSKSRGNVTNPDELIKKYGADTLRLYEMFMGPFSEAIPWSTENMIGVKRFLDKVWGLQSKVKSQTSLKSKVKNLKSSQKSKVESKVKNDELTRLVHKTIKKVTEDIENFRFNTAVSALMILTNEFLKQEKLSITVRPRAQLSVSSSRIRGRVVNYQLLIILLSLFAPHISEELWEGLGNKESIFKQPWPKYDAKLIKEEEIELVIQVNGKVRDKIKVAADINEVEAVKVAKRSPKIQKWTNDKEVRKVIFVRGKLLNIVV
ncbi:class I tRNA ligase family protein [Patescibacteria group bacterium]|nr:class I tRNA ligase family protein [Patescibacteria group bacterium]